MKAAKTKKTAPAAKAKAPAPRKAATTEPATDIVAASARGRARSERSCSPASLTISAGRSPWPT
jgi:hypothetical protein